VRILYLSAANSPHDETYLEALCRVHEVTVFSLHGGRVGEGLCEAVHSRRVGRLPRILRGHRSIPRGFDLYLAVYLSTYGYLAARARLTPTVAVALGSDIVFHTAKLRMLNKYRSSIAVRHANAVILPSEYALERALELGARRAYSVPWGVDIETFSPRGERVRLSEEFTLIHNRTLAPLYDPITVLEAWSLARPQMDEGVLVFVGDGPLRGKLLSLARRLGVKESVRFLGRVPYAEMPLYLRGSDAFITMTRGDVQSRSVMEAMAVGLPVIISDYPGNEGLVEHGVTGLVVRRGDPAGAARAILQLWEDENLRKRLGTAARIHVSREFDWRETVKRHLEIIEEARSRAP